MALPVRREPIRAAIVGPGAIGEVHARACLRAGATIVAAVASTPAKARLGAERLGAAQGFDSVEALLAGTDVDVVHICTPNYLHEPQVVAVLAAGLAVVCEKPLSTGVDSARRMTEQVEATGVVATVPFVYRFYSLVREMRARIARGDAGRISLLRGSYLQGWLANPADTNWRVDGTLGGPSRAFADIGVHWCDLLEFVTGQRITRLIATTATVVGERQPGAPVSTEDLVVMMFETDGGATGNLTISQVALGRRNQVELYVDGDRAAYGFNQEQPEELWIGGASAATIISRGGPDTTAAAARYDRLPTGHPQGYQDCFDSFVADTYAAVRGERPDGLPGFADGLRAAQLTAAVLESAATERWTHVGPATSSPAR